MRKPGCSDFRGFGCSATFEQSFTANVVDVGDDLVAFGDLIADPEKGLPYGTPVHSLLIHVGESGPEMLEFNDQGNSIPVEALERTELARDRVRFLFREPSEIFAGRVSLAEDEEADDDGESSDAIALGSICIHFTVGDERFEALREGLGLLVIAGVRTTAQ